MESSSNFRGLLTGGFTVTEKPQPLPGDLRIGWGIALVVLVLGASRGQRSSLQKLHFLAHLSRTQANRDRTMAVFRRTMEPSMLSIRVEPWVNRAVAFGVAEKLIAINGGRFAVLTEAGKEMHSKLIRFEVLHDEKSFLADVGRRATEKVVESIMKMEQF